MASPQKFEDIEGELVDVASERNRYTCSICDSFIVMSPVFLSPTLGFVCGFCHQFKKYFLDDVDNLQRQKLYERVAGRLRFPCEFCDFFHVFDSPDPTHEVQCQRRKFRCPFTKVNKWFLDENHNFCHWVDQDGRSMAQHIRQHHKELITNPPLKFSIKDLKSDNSPRKLLVAVLTNRSIVSITSEYDEECSCIIFRCRSNKPGNPNVNLQCRVELNNSCYVAVPYRLNVYPLGAKFIEKGRDYCTIFLGLEETEEFIFTFGPSTENEPTKKVQAVVEDDHDYWH